MEWTVERRRDPAAISRILRLLPDWFGLEDAIEEYVAAAATLESYLVCQDRRVVGAALLRRPDELFLIAVDPSLHSGGVGSALLEVVEGDLRRSGADSLQVSTVGPSFRHDGYAATRAFYLARGFRPIREFLDPDWGGPTLVLAKTLNEGRVIRSG